MIRNIATAALVAATLTTTAFAAGKVELTDANKEQIRQMLTEQGYEVGKIKTEDGLYEAYAKKDGQKYEVFLNGDFAVVRTEMDD